MPIGNNPLPRAEPGENTFRMPDGDVFEDTGSIPVVADDNKPCDTCGKTHKPGDSEHSEVLS